MASSTALERRWLTLVAMTGSLSMIMLDSTILGVALPKMARDLSMSPSAQAWVVNAYLVAMASCVALFGRLGDRIGRVWAFRIGVAAFALASIGCALATAAWALICARAAQGVAAAVMQPASAAIVVDLYPPDRRGRAMATYAGVSLLFLAAGPLVGGALLTLASWHWCFWVNVPLALVAITLTGITSIPRHAHKSRPIDWPSAVLLLCGMPMLVLGLHSVRTGASMAAGALALILPASAALYLFARRQVLIDAPLIDLKPLRDRALLASACTLGAFQLITVSQGIYGSSFLQGALHFTPMEAGLATLPMMVPVLGVVHFAGRMYDKSGPRRPVLMGLSLTALGAIIESVGVAVLSYPTMAIGMALIGTGCGFAMSPSTADALARARGHQRGEVSGIVQTFRLCGGALGVALFALVLQTTAPATPTPATPTPARDASSMPADLSPSGVAMGFALHAFVALAVLALAAACVRSRADTQDGSTATT